MGVSRMSDEATAAAAPPEAPVYVWPKLDADRVVVEWSREPIAGAPPILESEAPPVGTFRYGADFNSSEAIMYAHLDDEWTLVRFDSRPGERSVIVPANCDLKIGDWRWHADEGTFKLLPRVLRGKPKNMIALELLATKAFALGLRAIRDGDPLPSYTLDWLAEWERTLDAGGVAQGAPQDLSRDRRGGNDR
jgi:hypothetical protein